MVCLKDDAGHRNSLKLAMSGNALRGDRRASIFDFKVSFDVERCGFYYRQQYALARIHKV
jgi:hypothetical protein